MGHVGNPRSFRLTHHRLGKPLSGSLTSLLEHRLRYWGMKSDLANAEPDVPLPSTKTLRARKIKRLSRTFSSSFLTYLTKVRNKLLYEHPSWRQLWYPANYRGSYAHYYHLWKQSVDIVSRKSSLIRPTRRRLRVSPFGYYSHSYFLGKADGSFISKPMFVSRFLESRDLFEYSFPNSQDPSIKPPKEEDLVDSDEPEEEPLRSSVAQPAPGFTFDPYDYRTKRLMPFITTRFLYFFKDLMVKKAIRRKFKHVSPLLVKQFKKLSTSFSHLYPRTKSNLVVNWRGSHRSFTVSRGSFPASRLRCVSKNHELFDFFNFLEFKTDSFSAIPDVTPVSDLCLESLELSRLYLSRRYSDPDTFYDANFLSYYQQLKTSYRLGIKKRVFGKKIFADRYEETRKQIKDFSSLCREVAACSQVLKKFDPKILRFADKLRRLRSKSFRAFRPLLPGVCSSKKIPVKKVKLRTKLPNQTSSTLSPKRGKKGKPTSSKTLFAKTRKRS